MSSEPETETDETTPSDPEAASKDEAERLDSESRKAEERRQSYRLNKVLGAEIEHEQESVQARLFVIDISETGFRATNQFALPTDCHLIVRIILQAGLPPLESQARIVWSKELPMSGLFQFGFEFQELPQAQREQLQNFIAQEREIAQKPAQSLNLGRPWTTIRD